MAEVQDEMRHQDEAAKYKQKLVEMERRLAERDREAAAKVESVKSQAVFAVCARHTRTLGVKLMSRRTLRITPWLEIAVG